MIGNTLQSLPVDDLNVGIIQASEFMAHDPAHGVPVLQFVRERAKNMTQYVEGRALVAMYPKAIAESGEFLCHGVDVGRRSILYPLITARMPEHQGVIGAIGHNDGHRFNRLGPEWHLANNHPFAPDGVDAFLFQVHVNAAKDRAVGCTKPAIESEQDHGLELSVRLLNNLSDRGWVEHAGCPVGAQLGGADLFEPFAESNRRSQPPTFVCVIKHRDDAGAFTVVGIPANLAQQVSTIVGEVFWSKVRDDSSAAHVLEKPLDGPTVVGQMSGADIAGKLPGFLLIGKQVCQLLQRQLIGIGNNAGLAACVQVVLHALVFSERSFSIAVTPEVVQMPLDSLLKPAISAGLNGELFDWFAFVTTLHADRLNSVSRFCKSIHLSSQTLVAIVAPVENTLKNQACGSVAQRLEQGTHNPVEKIDPLRKSEKADESAFAKTAQAPNRRQESSRLNTALDSAALRPFDLAFCKHIITESAGCAMTATGLMVDAIARGNLEFIQGICCKLEHCSDLNRAASIICNSEGGRA